MTLKQLEVDTARQCYATKHRVMTGQVIHRSYCSAHQTSKNNFLRTLAFRALRCILRYRQNLIMKVHFITYVDKHLSKTKSSRRNQDYQRLSEGCIQTLN